VPIVSMKLVGAAGFVLLSVGLAAAFLVQWPKPVSMTFAGASLLSGFGALLALCRIDRREYALRVRKAIFLTSGCFGLGFVGLAWKYSESAPAFSSASLVATALLCLGALTTFLITRSVGEKTNPKSR